METHRIKVKLGDAEFDQIAMCSRIGVKALARVAAFDRRPGIETAVFEMGNHARNAGTEITRPFAVAGFRASAVRPVQPLAKVVDFGGVQRLAVG